MNELPQAHELGFRLFKRNIKALYRQSVLGFAWAIIQPLLQIIIFSVIFGKVAKVSTDGIPYVLFSTVAIIPWTYITTALTQSSQSLVTGQRMLGKVYFPRLIFPLTPVFSKLVNFFISILLLAAIFADVLASQGIDEQDLRSGFLSPSLEHP